MTVPIATGLRRSGIAEMIARKTWNGLLIGDSKSNQVTLTGTGTSQSNNFQGIFRTWANTWRGVGIGAAGGQGLGITTYAAQGIGTTSRAPNETFDGSVTRFAPHNRLDLSFGATLAADTNIFRSTVTPGGDPAANPFAAQFNNVSVNARFICLRHAAGAHGVRLDGYRCLDDATGGTLVTSGTGVSLNDATSALVNVDVTIGTHGTRFYPDPRLRMDGASNTADDSAHVAATRIWRPTVTGGELFTMAVGGTDTGYWLNSTDADTSNSGTDAMIEDAFLPALLDGLDINLLMIDLGVNEAAQGGTSGYFRRMSKMVNRCLAARRAQGRDDLRVLFFTPYACGSMTVAQAEAMGNDLHRMAISGTQAQPTPTGSTLQYQAADPERIAHIHIPEVLRYFGPVTNGIESTGRVVPNASSGIYLVDNVHPNLNFMDYLWAKVWQVLSNPPSDSFTRGATARPRPARINR